ncbi:MAG: RNA-binding protein [Thaumarchaeota archaeon]|nr:RNA-binding protein [Nitrososphaerota archaeon]MDD9842385.1 RNA-binding protein [Nitrososphaerota archaeon]RNJ71377.1 MAG: RNA-binding protein [Thaumarchaeota archaeon S14]RNJ72926.1 MAG: RNA-binding protein [Thaumarchaeota archaeon S13]RNJ75161.1 MAG: RNA-binding protein [Thaumarchaeota archaeon S15]
MALEAAKRSISEIERTLEAEREGRERLIKGSRDVIALCSRAIVTVHAGRVDEASEIAARAREALAALREGAPDRMRGHMAVAEQELVEALALIAIVSGRDVPSPESIPVGGAQYILGLLDCIGELKRQVLDRIRAGEAGEAERLFEVMGGLYDMLYPMAAYDKVVKEARRKLDVNRELIERARLAVTEALARARLERRLDGAGAPG